MMKIENNKVEKLDLEKIKSLVKRFSISEETYKSMKHLQTLETAIKSMRKTECWGYNGCAINFEWPTAQELLQILKSTPSIKVADLKYKKRSDDNSFFGGFQIILSNGKSSPVFNAFCQNA
jgi:hypothetical protein